MKLICIALIGLSLGATVAACSGEEKKKETKAPDVPVMDPHGMKIGFYNSDSLNEGYVYLKEQDAVLKKKQEKFQKELEGRQRGLQQRYQRLMEAEQKMLYPAAQMQEMKNEFERQSRSLEMFQQTEGGKLQEEAMEMQTVLNNKIQEFAKRYCEKYKLDMLIMHAPGGQFTYYNPKMDVTESFIDFVNEEHKKMDKELGGDKEEE